MATLFLQVWKEIIIYLISNSKARNGPQKIPVSFNNIYVWRAYIYVNWFKYPSSHQYFQTSSSHTEEAGLFHVSPVAFLNSKRQQHDITKLKWEEAKEIMARTREEFYPLHIISSIHACKTHFNLHLSQNDHRHNPSQRRPWKLSEIVSVVPLLSTVLFYDNNSVHFIIIEWSQIHLSWFSVNVGLLYVISLFKLNVSSLRQFLVTYYYGSWYKL